MRFCGCHDITRTVYAFVRMNGLRFLGMFVIMNRGRWISRGSAVLAAVWMSAGLCACAPTPVETVPVKPVPKVLEVQTDEAKPKVPERDMTSWVAVSAEALRRGAVNPLPHQEVILHPSPDAIRYLMRAARYRAAVEAVRNIENPDASMQFIALKAKILANQCSKETPCSSGFETLTKPAEFLNSIYDYWHQRALIADGKFKEAIAGTLEFHQNYRDQNKTQELVLALCKAMDRKNQFQTNEPLDDVQALLTAAFPKANAFEEASFIYYEMRIAEAQGKEERAQAKRDALVIEHPATQMSLWPDLAGTLEEMTLRYSISERMARTRRLIKHFDYDNARKELKAIVENPETPKTDRENAEWELARVSLTNSEDPKLSEKIYRKWAQKSGPKREEAVFGIARALSRQLDYRAAIAALNDYDRQFPRGKYKARSLYLRGWYWFDLRENEKARPLLLKYAQDTRDTAVWGFYAQTFIRDGLWKEAVEAFENLKRNNNPIVRGKALYWQAYAEHQMGHEENAKQYLRDLHASFPLTWYDMLAYQREQDWYGIDAEKAFMDALRWDIDPPKSHVFHAFGMGPEKPPVPQSSVWKKITDLAEHDAIAEARELYQANEQALLKGVKAEHRQAFRHYATHLVEAYHDAWKDNSGSIRALSDIWPERDNPAHAMAYPQPFAPLVESLAQDWNIPHYFVYGIMLQESRFRTWQVSSADAIGALQMIPKTARPIAKTLGFEYHPDTFFDPRVGFPYSVYYMHMHDVKWGHNLTFTAGSYNGGPHRIGPWAIRDKGKTIDFIVDEFSFDESRHYARKVAEHTLRFAYLYVRNPEQWREITRRLFPNPVPDIEAVEDWGL